MAGTKYNTKQTLIDAWKALIFPNKQKLITGAAHQTAGLDLIESLWPTSTLSACTTEVFTTTTNGATITVTRIVCGTSVTLIGRITNDAVAAAKRCDLANVIPLNYGDHLWFKMESFVTLMNSSGGGGSNGYIELSEVSSYTNGSAVDNYITSSPLDLEAAPLSISYITAEQAVVDGHTVTSTTSSTSTDMSFVIKGQLI